METINKYTLSQGLIIQRVGLSACGGRRRGYSQQLCCLKTQVLLPKQNLNSSTYNFLHMVKASHTSVGNLSLTTVCTRII